VCAARARAGIQQRRTDNDEAVGYLGDRLAGSGRGGAGGQGRCRAARCDQYVTFDWDRRRPRGLSCCQGPGTDRRLDQSSRASAAARLAARIDRRRTHTDDELFGGAPEDDT
jgi:GTP-binding protein